MAKYAERHLYENEYIVEEAPRDVWGLVGWWCFGISCFWMLLIPLALAIKKSIIFSRTEIVLTNRRLICKQGVFHTQSKDIPLLKIQGVYVDVGFWGKIFNVGTTYIDTEYGTIKMRLQDADEFKTAVISQIDMFERERLSSQSIWTAQALLQGAKDVPFMDRQSARRTGGSNLGGVDPYAGYERRRK